MKQPAVLYLVVPCYNEEAVLPETSQRLLAKMTALIEKQQIDVASRVMFVDDGSRDQTWPMICNLHESNPLFVGVKLSRNRGQQNALLAGLNTAIKYADATISIDADLQDDIDVIDKMMNEYYQGAEIVYGVRSSRKKDTFLKRFTAQSYYKIMKKIGVDLIYNCSECRLMSKTAVEALNQYQEVNLFLSGIVPQLGYQTAEVTYERDKRFAGKSKWSTKQLFGKAIDGITSFSNRPLTAIFGFGILATILGLAGFVTTLVLMYVIGLSGLWPVLSAMVMLTGVVLAALGVVGVYVGKTYLETKHRPRYLIEKELK